MKTQQDAYMKKSQRVWRLVRLVPRLIRFRLKNDQVALYSCLCEEFLQLGGIYVKFLQGVLLQSDAMKNWEGANKYKVFEAVPTVLVDIEKTIQAELKVPSTEIFSEVAKTPFATGSFGQVYQARLKSGEKVIIKVLRPHIKDILKFDLRLLSFIAKLFSSDFTSLDVSPKRAIRDFKVMTLREVDYINEAVFAEQMYRVFKNDPVIVIPKTYREFCTKQMIVQDYVPGVSIAEILKTVQTKGVDAVAETKRLTGSDLRFQLQHMSVEVMFKFFTEPRMPGDLHPGNVRLLPDNKVGIVDFGISAQQPRIPNIFYTMLKQLTHVNEDGATAGQMFVTYIKYFSYDLYLSFDRLSRQFGESTSLADLVTSYAQKVFDKNTDSHFKVADIKYSTMFGAYVNKTINAGNKFCIVTKVTEVELLRAVQTIVALIDSLDMRAIITPIFSEVYERVTKELPQFTREPSNPLTLHQATATIDSWLSRLAMKNPELFLQIRSFISKQKHQASRS